MAWTRATSLLPNSLVQKVCPIVFHMNRQHPPPATRNHIQLNKPAGLLPVEQWFKSQAPVQTSADRQCPHVDPFPSIASWRIVHLSHVNNISLCLLICSHKPVAVISLLSWFSKRNQGKCTEKAIKWVSKGGKCIVPDLPVIYIFAFFEGQLFLAQRDF